MFDSNQFQSCALARCHFATNCAMFLLWPKEPLGGVGAGGFMFLLTFEEAPAVVDADFLESADGRAAAADDTAVGVEA